MTETTPLVDDQVWARVAVIGAGAMGAQIAGVIALSGRQVALADSSLKALDRAGQTLRGRWDSRVAKGAMTTADRDAAYERIWFCDNVAEAVADVGLVIEAVIEKLDVKRDLLVQVDGAARAGTVIASNSSSFVPSSMADAVGEAGRFLGLHFFNPALVMRCVEVVAGPATDPQVIADATRFVEQIGKEPVVLRKEINGFVANRILNVVRDEAIHLMEGGYASVTDIDRACRTALGYPMGPFELMDLTGIDIGYLTKQARYAESGDPKDAPSRTVSALVEAGQLGRKSGRGFYVYDDTGTKQGENPERPSPQ